MRPEGQTGADDNAGLKALLIHPVYRAFIWLFGGGRAGCLLDPLPGDVAEYHGIDANPAYIAAARSRWRDRPAATFACADLASADIPHRGRYDIVAALSVVHHLDDASARRLFTLAHDALAPGGRLITWDCAWVEGQRRAARWLIARDSGRTVRTVDGDHALAAERFDRVKADVLHDTLRAPCTICAMTCTKAGSLAVGPGAR